MTTRVNKNGQTAKYTHDPFKGRFNDKISYSFDENGMVTIRVDSDEEFDEVTIPAALIIKIRRMLFETHKIEWVEK